MCSCVHGFMGSWVHGSMGLFAHAVSVCVCVCVYLRLCVRVVNGYMGGCVCMCVCVYRGCMYEVYECMQLCVCV